MPREAIASKIQTAEQIAITYSRIIFMFCQNITSDARAWLSDVTIKYLLFAAALAYRSLGTLSPEMQELGCAIPHSDFLTLLSSVYSWLKIKTTPAVIIQDIITSNCGAWLSITTLRYFCLAKYYPDLKMKTTYKIKATQKGKQPQKWKWPQIWRQMKMN